MLLLYISIFRVRSFRIAAYVATAVSVCWFVSVFLEEMLLCRPLAFNWDPSIKGGRCANRPAAYLAAGIINLLTDIMVLCLPVPMVWKLQLPTRKKLGLSIVFGVGFVYVFGPPVTIETRRTRLTQTLKGLRDHYPADHINARLQFQRPHLVYYQH